MENKKLKIIFVGIPDMAIITLSNLLLKGFNIVGVVPPKKSHETYFYFKNFILNKGLNIIDFDKSPNEADCIEQLKKLNADIGVVSSYNNKLSPEFLTTTKMGYINSHPSLLPDYRGAMPYFHIVKNGEKESGITLHYMDESFDTGDIIYQKKFKLSPLETMGTIFNKTNYMISDALIEVLTDLENGKELKRTPQEKTKEYKTAPRVNGCFKLDFKNDVEELECFIRACNPFYQVYCGFRGLNLQIIKAHIEKKQHNFELGKIVIAQREKIAISVLNGLLFLDVFQVGTWGVLNPCEFFELFHPQINESVL